jgi:hypothetical protein
MIADVWLINGDRFYNCLISQANVCGVPLLRVCEPYETKESVFEYPFTGELFTHAAIHSIHPIEQDD